jgi:hypothetical protein
MCIGYTVRSQWPGRLKRGSAGPLLLRLGVRIPPVAGISVSCECRMLSGRGLYVELITLPECDRVALIMRRPWSTTASRDLKFGLHSAVFL